MKKELDAHGKDKKKGLTKILHGGKEKTEGVVGHLLGLPNKKLQHLILCPPAALNKWKLFIGKDSYAIVGQAGGRYAGAEPDSKGKAVTLCELSTLRSPALSMHLLGVEWATVWVDLRGREEPSVCKMANWWGLVGRIKADRRYLIENTIDLEGASKKRGKGKVGEIQAEEGRKGNEEEEGVFKNNVNCVDWLCKRIAFCFNKFESAKRVHAWVREQDDEDVEIVDRLQKVLQKYLLGGVGTGGKINFPKVKIVKTKITKAQMAVYEKHAHSFLAGKSTSVIANGLMRLRSLCFSVYDNGSAPGTAHFFRGGGRDEDLIEAIESKSGKMEGLANVVEGLLGKGKKIIILASLPAALTQAHIFLNAMGIKHEFMADKGGANGDFGCGGYIQGQMKLEEFEEGGETDVLLSSVASISGIEGGIIPTSTDAIVVLDEDWSGRQDVQVANLVKRTLMAGQKIEITRIVAEGTIEELLFGEMVSSADYDVESGADIEVKLDFTGCIVSACNKKTGEVELILGRNIWGLRGKGMDEVLGVDKPTRGNGDDAGKEWSPQCDFLPLVADGRQNDSVNRAIGGQLSVLESRAAQLSSSYEQTYGSVGGGRGLGRSLLDYTPEAVSFNGQDKGREDDMDRDVDDLLEALTYNACNGKVEHIPNCTIISAPNVATFPPFAVSRMDTGDLELRKYASSIFSYNADEGGEEDEEVTKKYFEKVTESWSAAGLGCSDETKAVRLLTYPVKENVGEASHLFAQSFVDFVSEAPMKDGAIGSEPVLYGPPLIPGVLPPAFRGSLDGKQKDAKKGTAVTPPGMYGMLGDGKMLSAFEAARVASKTSTATAEYRMLNGDRDEDDENAGYLNSVLLWIKRPPGDRGKKRKKDGGMDEDMIARYAVEGELPEETEARVRAEARKIRLQKQSKVANALAKNSAARSHAGPGVPMLFQSSARQQSPVDRSLVEPKLIPADSDAKTGDKDHERNTLQGRLMKQAGGLPGPKVYFGPFGAGFLNSTGGQSGIQQPRPVSGISLPMGVSLKEKEKNSVKWSAKEDEELKNASERYRFNWEITSFCVNGVGNRRSARQCMERWNELVALDGKVSKKAKHNLEEFERMEGIGGQDVGRVLSEMEGGLLRGEAAKKWAVKKAEAGRGGGTGVDDTLKRLHALQAAGTKRRKPPSIPGSQDPSVTLNPSHSSHASATKQATLKLIEDNPHLEAEEKQKAEEGDLWPLEVMKISQPKTTKGKKRKKSVSK